MKTNGIGKTLKLATLSALALSALVPQTQPTWADHNCPRIPWTNIKLPNCLNTHGTGASNETKICEAQFASPQLVLLSKSPIKATGTATKVSYLVRMNPGDWKICTKKHWKPEGWKMKVNFIRTKGGAAIAHQFKVTLNAKGAFAGSKSLQAGEWRITTWLDSPVTQKQSASKDFAVLYQASLPTITYRKP